MKGLLGAVAGDFPALYSANRLDKSCVKPMYRFPSRCELRGTYQWLEVPAYTRNSVKRVSLRAKGYVWDTRLVCHMMRIFSPEAAPGHPAFGALFESLVIGHCLRQLQKEQTVPAAWHYRRHSGAEVDLILERDGKLFSIEVKATSNPTDRDARGAAAFQEEYGKQAAPGLLIHAGDEVRRIGERCMAVPFDLQRNRSVG